MSTKTSERTLENTSLKEKIKFPKKFKVILLNDDVTSMDFVVDVLTQIFHHSAQSAITLMLKVHNEGSAVCGVYIKEIALSKQNEVRKVAISAGYPLRVNIEEE
ncbi:ATP-dependent Clp protease adaptor ClpS [Campylobacter sp. RM16192]|uniref:ATP-dependent Clp protease adaptor ClpS n=1 Tax=Campylobacter sp. RM16192 TaxID=1660080 RepID=UPI0014521A51|nr:ATP-dependent Clp protease adaptor ClpS [Campylobacter sp. RM16192]QCD52282.1 ATP-dependent Clp protease adaptor protein ClpS [Campylobacter sp. RM16192]